MKIRFSLMTLLLLSLWLGLVGVVYLRWKPWAFETKINKAFEGRTFAEWCDLSQNGFTRNEMKRFISTLSPDGIRSVENVSYLENIPDGIFHLLRSEDSYWWITYQESPKLDMRVLGFVNDDTLLFAVSKNTIIWKNPDFIDYDSIYFRFAHRRHPEWWWGHFYRPEVWALILLTIVIVVRTLRARTSTLATVAAAPP